MTYAQKNLSQNEKIKYFANIHWIIYFTTIVWFLICVFSVVSIARQPASETGLFMTLFVTSFWVAAFLLIKAFITQKTSEFVITTKRLIMKTGLIRRNSIDIFISKVESIKVNQGILGRIFNYGTIVVCGSGGSADGFKHIANPTEFQRKLQCLFE